jgi:putative ABC transport system substrate-binding protein
MIQRRLALISIAILALLTAPLAGTAQHAKVARVGHLSGGSFSEPPTLAREPFERGLRELGWTPGSNVIIEYRYAEGTPERLPDLASELVRLKVDAIVVRGSLAAQAARQATSTIPIVMSAVADPVGQGVIRNLARPGGNVTGLAWLTQAEIEGKHLELLKQAVPGLVRVATLVNPMAVSDPDGSRARAIGTAARSLGLDLQNVEVTKPEGIAEAFTVIGRARVGALAVRADAVVLEPNRAQVVALALKHRLPTVYPWRHYVDAGGLMSYNTSIPVFHHRSATFVDRILKGAKPGDIPIEQPTKYELVINLKTAKALGLTIPPSLLLRADHVIQ